MKLRERIRRQQQSDAAILKNMERNRRIYKGPSDFYDPGCTYCGGDFSHYENCPVRAKGSPTATTPEGGA